MRDNEAELDDFECIYLYQDKNEEWIVHPDRGDPLDPIPTRGRALAVVEREFAGLPVAEERHPSATPWQELGIFEDYNPLIAMARQSGKPMLTAEMMKQLKQFMLNQHPQITPVQTLGRPHIHQIKVRK